MCEAQAGQSTNGHDCPAMSHMAELALLHRECVTEHLGFRSKRAQRRSDTLEGLEHICCIY